MAGYFLSEAEQDALYGLPPLAQLLYVLAIRPRMDKATMTVGVRPKVSWKAFSEWLETHGVPGIKAEAPSEQQCRRASKQLEKHGLLLSRSQGRQLIFELPLAVVDFSVSNKADRLADSKNAISAIDPDSYNLLQPSEIKRLYSDLGRILDSQADSNPDKEADTHHYCTVLDCTVPITRVRDDEVPSADGWIQFFMAELGYTSADLHKPACLAMFENWHTRGLSAGLIRRCIPMGQAKLANGRRPDNPTYFRSFVDEYVRESNANYQRYQKPGELRPLSSLRLWRLPGEALVVAYDADQAINTLLTQMGLDDLPPGEPPLALPDSDSVTLRFDQGRKQETTAGELVRLVAEKAPFLAQEPAPW